MFDETHYLRCNDCGEELHDAEGLALVNGMIDSSDVVCPVCGGHECEYV